jgi:hypothetical protein
MHQTLETSYREPRRRSVTENVRRTQSLARLVDGIEQLGKRWRAPREVSRVMDDGWRACRCRCADELDALVSSCL